MGERNKGGEKHQGGSGGGLAEGKRGSSGSGVH